MQLKAGTRLHSAVCDTQAMVVRAPKDDVDLRCGGHPMVPQGAERPAGLAIDEAHGAGTAMGKRYSDDDRGLEVLITKAGAGSLSVGDDALHLKDAKPLPSSD